MPSEPRAQSEKQNGTQTSPKRPHAFATYLTGRGIWRNALHKFFHMLPTHRNKKQKRVICNTRAHWFDRPHSFLLCSSPGKVVLIPAAFARICLRKGSQERLHVTLQTEWKEGSAELCHGRLQIRADSAKLSTLPKNKMKVKIHSTLIQRKVRMRTLSCAAGLSG